MLLGSREYRTLCCPHTGSQEAFAQQVLVGIGGGLGSAGELAVQGGGGGVGSFQPRLQSHCHSRPGSSCPGVPHVLGLVAPQVWLSLLFLESTPPRSGKDHVRQALPSKILGHFCGRRTNDMQTHIYSLNIKLSEPWERLVNVRLQVATEVELK